MTGTDRAIIKEPSCRNDGVLVTAQARGDIVPTRAIVLTACGELLLYERRIPVEMVIELAAQQMKLILECPVRGRKASLRCLVHVRLAEVGIKIFKPE